MVVIPRESRHGSRYSAKATARAVALATRESSGRASGCSGAVAILYAFLPARHAAFACMSGSVHAARSDSPMNGGRRARCRITGGEAQPGRNCDYSGTALGLVARRILDVGRL